MEQLIRKLRDVVDDLPLWMQSKSADLPVLEPDKQIELLQQMELLTKLFSTFFGDDSPLRSHRHKLRQQVAEYMQDQGFDKIQTERGSVTVNVEVFAAINDTELWFAWLRANGHGALIKESVHPSTQKSLLKDLLSAGEESSLPEEVKVTTMALAKVNLKRGELFNG